MNLVSSPGSGKTSLLEKTIADLKNDVEFSVIEGDQQTTNDAENSRTKRSCSSNQYRERLSPRF